MFGPTHKIALVMRRHTHEYGTSLDHLGKIAVTAAKHSFGVLALLAPSAAVIG